MIKKNRFVRNLAGITLSLMTSLTLIPIDSVMAAADGPGSLTFDCLYKLPYLLKFPLYRQSIDAILN